MQEKGSNVAAFQIKEWKLQIRLYKHALRYLFLNGNCQWDIVTSNSY